MSGTSSADIPQAVAYSAFARTLAAVASIAAVYLVRRCARDARRIVERIGAICNYASAPIVLFRSLLSS